MGKGSKTLFGVISGVAVAAAAIFLSKKENREKTKAVAKKVAHDLKTVAKKTSATATKKVATAKKQVTTKTKVAQKKIAKVKKALQ